MTRKYKFKSIYSSILSRNISVPNICHMNEKFPFCHFLIPSIKNLTSSLLAYICVSTFMTNFADPVYLIFYLGILDNICKAFFPTFFCGILLFLRCFSWPYKKTTFFNRLQKTRRFSIRQNIFFMYIRLCIFTTSDFYDY